MPGYSRLVLGALLFACNPVYPGEPVGTFSVTADLVENTCGASAYPVRERTTFRVEVRNRDGEAFWRLPSEPLVSGRVMADDSLRFELARAYDPSPQCRLVQEDRIDIKIRATSEEPHDGSVDGASADASADASMDDDPADATVTDTGLVGLDGGTDAGTEASDEELELSGTQRIDVREFAGDCSALIGGQGFVGLPCHADLVLVGSETSSF
ncbi:MAG: hypothetical protein AAGF12_12930 [Myxococcota bacterium]